MVFGSSTSSLVWDSTSSPFQFQSSSLSNIPNQYDRSLVAPLTFSQRKRYFPATINQLPPLKLRSTLTWRSSEQEKFLVQSISSTERESTIFKQKYDRLRASLSQSLEQNRHAFDKVHYKKSGIQQNIDERDGLINQLLTTTIQLNEKINESRNEIINQRRKRDHHEMQQSKLRRNLIRLNNNKDQANEISKTSDQTKLIEQCEARLLKFKNQCKQEITDRDQQIEELKENLSEEFQYQSDEHLKFLKAAEHAFQLESQKRDILQEYVDDYESNVYRARKPCCISTSYRLSKLSTQLRLYLIMELALHELFRSSCSCGSFRRSYQTFLRLHKN